jgi:hypothetical protein
LNVNDIGIVRYKTVGVTTLDSITQIVFHTPGASPHYSDLVIAALDEKFPNKWTDRSGLIPWPPRRPDLTILAFFFGECNKNTVCVEKIRHLQHMKGRICAAIETATPEMLSRV